jgi:hypothetical protein
MLSQEVIFQHLVKGEYNQIIKFLHDHKELLNDEVTIHHAVSIFLTELFAKVQKERLDGDLKLHLQLLFIIHAKGFYTLPDADAIKLIGILYEGQYDEMWYKAAKPFSEDPICARIIECYEMSQVNLVAHSKMTVDPALQQYRSNTSGNFEVKKITAGNIPTFLKVFVRGIENLEPLKGLIEKLPTVRRANITQKDNRKDDLTLYLQPPYNIEEMQEQVEAALEAHYNRKPNDPVFEQEFISEISDTAYFQVLDMMIDLVIGMERTKATFGEWGEDDYRNLLLSHLNTLSQKHSATGESFNSNGKTDILFRDQYKNNLLIAECKLWKGESKLADAIDQLLTRYVTWRDEKTAILIFNNSISGFTQLIQKAVNEVQRHPQFHLFAGKRRDTSYSFIFRDKVDPSKTIRLELVLFNFV